MSSINHSSLWGWRGGDDPGGGGKCDRLPLLNFDFAITCIENLSPFYAKPKKKIDIAALFLRASATVRANSSRKRSFSKTLFKPEEFENAGFAFQSGRKTVSRRSFQKTIASRSTGGCFIFRLSGGGSLDRKHFSLYIFKAKAPL